VRSCKGYFVSPRYGCAIHSHHPYIDPTNNCYSVNLLSEGDKIDLEKLAKAKLGAAHGRNFIFANRSDIYLSKSQIRYAFRRADASYIGVKVPDLKMGSDGLVNFFNSRDDINYCIWGGKNVNDKKRYASDATFQSNLLFNALYQDGEEEIISLDVLCHDVVEYYRKEKSILLEPDTNKSMFIACAWTSKKERRMFELNPFVMKVDATCHTNNEKRHLLTFTSKTVSAKSFVFLKVYLPDQKASTFRWVFQVAVPKLLGKKTSERVRYAMTDGDSHEFSELDKAIKKYFVNATRGRCAWHIIDKGWKRYGINERIVAPDRRFVLKQALNTILNWLYVFCKAGGCEDEEEYVLSKSLLLAYIHNHVAKAIAVGSDKQVTQVDTILKFLNSHVFVHEEHFIFYPRKKVLHFDEATDITPTTVDDTERRIDVRSTLKPLYDQICSLYEGKDASHCEMPTIASVVDAMNDKIHDVNRFFNDVRKKKKNGQSNTEKYVSVCTQQEKSRSRRFVSSNGLR
jgi:hypothetical protein